MLRNLGMIAASCLFGLLLIEGAFRLTGYRYPLVARFDQDTGFTNGPNIEGWNDTESIEWVALDEFGLRMPDDPKQRKRRTQAKPEGVFRIAMLGDSYTESFHVSYDESFPVVLERQINRCAALDRPVEVLNFGVSGFSNVQELLQFRHKVKNFEPDLVFLVVHADNDLRNNYRKQEQNLFAPYAELRGGRLMIDTRFRDEPAFKSKLQWSNLRNDVANHFWSASFAINVVGRARLMSWHHARMENLVSPQPVEASASAPVLKTTPRWPDRPSPDEATITAMFDPALPAPPLYNRPEFYPPQNDADEVLWRLVEASVLELRNEVTGSGAGLWLTTTATGVAIDPDPASRAAWVVAHNYPEPEYARHRMQSFAEANAIKFVSINQTLREYAEAHRVDLQYFDKKGVSNGHWNRIGHRLVGETLADAICQSFEAKRQ